MSFGGIFARTESQLFGAALAGLLAVGVVTPVAALETRTYVVSWFNQAVSNAEGDCAGGINPDVGTQYEKNLVTLGKTPEEAKDIIRRWLAKDDNGVLGELMNDRARVDGVPVNAYAHPAAVVDPQLNTVTGNIAYGFDLDGKGADDPDGFLEPDTGEQGIDNQLFRALGCSRAFRGTKENPGAFWVWVWITVKDTMPAWLVSISGEDLDKDGPVTITFDRALEYAKSNPNGYTRPYMTYRVDPDPRSHNEFSGRIKEGVLTISDPAPFSMLQSMMYAPEINLRDTRLRMNMRDDGTIEGFIGGYQSWRDVYFGLAWGGKAAETTVTGELPGLFYLLKRHADASPDQQTGENNEISAVYRLEAVPAFHVQTNQQQAASAER